MLLLMLLGVGSVAPSGPIRAYAAISFGLVDGSAIGFSLVNSGDLSISDTTSAEGSVS